MRATAEAGPQRNFGQILTPRTQHPPLTSHLNGPWRNSVSAGNDPSSSTHLPKWHLDMRTPLPRCRATIRCRNVLRSPLLPRHEAKFGPSPNLHFGAQKAETLPTDRLSKHSVPRAQSIPLYCSSATGFRWSHPITCTRASWSSQ